MGVSVKLLLEAWGRGRGAFCRKWLLEAWELGVFFEKNTSGSVGVGVGEHHEPYAWECSLLFFLKPNLMDKQKNAAHKTHVLNSPALNSEN